MHDSVLCGSSVHTERTAVECLLEGRAVYVRGIGNSMTPLLKSGQVVLVAPNISHGADIVRKGDIVLARVRGNIYLHKVTAIKGNLFQISNNHGHVNGWTDKIYGRVV